MARCVRVVVASCLLLACSGAERAPLSTVDPAPMDAGPPAVTVVAESGFFDVPPQPTTATYPARLFYSFHPADEDAVHKPIALVFNGGPGFATTSGLLPYGTGPFTLDPAAPVGAPPIANPASWTSFANLLYVDMRLAGFSYGLKTSGSVVPPVPEPFSSVEDASDYVRALLAFFSLHPALASNPVIVVGESYGGTRAQYFLDLVLRYATEASAGGSDLQGLLQAHFDSIFPDRAGSAFDEATIATQFGAQVLIQPLVLGDLQWNTQQTGLEAADPYVGPYVQGGPAALAVDAYDVNEPAGWSALLDAKAATAFSSEQSATPLLGAPLASIADLLPAARHAAFHPLGSQSNGGAPVDMDTALTSLLGPLEPGDSYFVGQAIVAGGYAADPQIFAKNLLSVRTFITNARFDPAIYAPAIPASFAQAGLGGVVDTTPRPGVARPGWFTVDIDGGADGGPQPKTIEVRFPSYVSSGHMVAVSQPSDLHDDVAAWLAQAQGG